METIVIAFSIKETARKSDEYATEYCRQLQMQEQGLKELTIREYLENRRNYTERNSAEEGITQKREREKARTVYIEEMRTAFATQDQETVEVQMATAAASKAKVGESPKQPRGQGCAEKLEEMIHQQKQAMKTMLVTLYKSCGSTNEEQENAVNEAVNKWEKEEKLSVELSPRMIAVL